MEAEEGEEEEVEGLRREGGAEVAEEGEEGGMPMMSVSWM